MSVKIIFLGFLLLLGETIGAQEFPVTTKSKAAENIFRDYGWDYAFHMQDKHLLETMDTLISMDSTFALAYLHRGGYSPLHLRKQYFELAKKNTKYISYDEKRLVDAFYSFMWDYDQMKAIEILKELSAKYPKEPHLVSYIGIRYLNLGEYENALNNFQEAITRDPNFAPAYQLAGAMCINLEKFDLAEEYLEKYKNYNPNFWTAYKSLGNLYLAQGKLNEADNMYELAMSMDSSADARDQIAWSYLSKGFYDQAEFLFKENLRLHPEDPNTASSLGDYYLRQNKFNDAIELYQQATSIKPSHTIARNYYDNMVNALISQRHQVFEKQFKEKRIDSLSDIFTFNAELITTAGKSLDLSEIPEYWSTIYQRGVDELNLQTRIIKGSYDQFFASELGKYILKKDDSEIEHGTYNALWRRNTDGWKIHHIMFISKSE